MHKIQYPVLAGLLLAAAAYGAVDSSLLNLVMPDAKIVSGVHVDRSKTSPFGRYVLSQMQTNDEGLQKFIEQTGFDPRRDLSEILISSTGGQTHARTLIVGRGTFDRTRIASMAKRSGATLLSYHGVEILQRKEGDMEGGLALLDGSTAVLGDLESVRAAIDRRQNGAAAPNALTDKVRKVSADNDVWFITLGPPSEFLNGKIADPNLNGAMQGTMLQSVQEASGGLRFGAVNVSLQAEVVARSEKDASALVDVVRFLAGMVQLNRPADPGAPKGPSLLDNMQLSAESNVMKLSLAMPEDQLEKLLAPGARHPRKAAAVRP
ncbi:MAG TPA: hypothetical protein VKV15_04535 [Bryobacteraceae bacterium]|nr:hypothetical protein [Bryobacteraceae bacterium]